MSDVRINPIAPDPNTSGRYGSSDERAQREKYAPEVRPKSLSDRLEISTDARENYRQHFSGPDLDFARKALDKAPQLPDRRIDQILDRVESGSYRRPSVLWSVAGRMRPILQ